MFKNSQDWLTFLSLLNFASLLIPQSLQAQAIADQTTNTAIIQNLNIQGLSSDLVEAGTLRGNNLFHSFNELNVAANRGLFFSNPANVNNIFTRVTGGSSSNILGRLGVLGNANLFLLNPNGILFGENSSLALNGSLYVTTGDRLRFADGTTFSAANPESSNLLTSSIPIGLGFTSGNSGTITVRSQASPIFPLPLPTEVTETLRPISGLILLPTATLALIGSSINFEKQASVIVLGGKVGLGAVLSGEVKLTPTNNKFAISYDNVNQFGNIKMSDNSSINNIGQIEGDIEIVGDRLSILDKSLILTGSVGSLFSGRISLQANQLIELIGSNNFAQSVELLTSSRPNSSNINGLISFSNSNVNGGDIIIKTPVLNISNSSFIVSSILSSGRAGNISINAPQSVTVDVGAIFSGTPPTSAGSSANINIETGKLTAINNGIISTTNLGFGIDSGDVSVNATESVRIVGRRPILAAGFIQVTSGLITTSFNSSNSGNIRVNTPFLSLQDGGVLTTDTQGSGQGGNVTVKANRIELSGIDPSNQFPSAIIALARQGSTGNGGNINVSAKEISIQNLATVSVASFGIGNAGNLKIAANQIRLAENASILAASALGDGGNIDLRIGDSLLLRDRSQILTSSAGNGNGGNVAINSGTIIGLDNSQINANAFRGRGGNIQINTDGLFFSPNSSISASSEIGVSGNISISSLDISSRNALILPLESFIQVDAIVANSCLANRNSTQGSFVVTGSGGLPASPYDLLTAEYSTTSIQPISGSPSSANSASDAPKDATNPSLKRTAKARQEWKLGDPVIEVRDLARSSSGEVLPVITYADADALGCFKNK
ncbi:MAG: hypothetical protein DCE90_08120 [Pseudanabaena sp.]|nr:MAG: hypothetical protein DCE90_08120 [Pseudanabaena sp.]